MIYQSGKDNITLEQLLTPELTNLILHFMMLKLGGACYSNTTTLTTGVFGEWKTEQFGVGAGCNNASANYFLEIKINNETQGERKRLMIFDFLRRDTDGILSRGNLNINLMGAKNVVIDGRTNPRNMTRGVFRFQHLPIIPNTRVITFDIDSNGQENTSAIVMEYNSNGSDLIRHDSGAGIYTWDKNADLHIRDIFGRFMGSLTNRITKLFVQNIDVSGNVNSSNYTLNGTTIKDWDEISSGNSLIVGGNYLYNDSASIYFNETKLNNTIDARAITINLTNYALKNQSETFAGNVTTTQTGFFGLLGSLSSRITELFVQDIDVSNNIKTKTLDVSTNATLESLIFRRHDAFGMAILLNNTNEAIRIFATPNITNPANGAGLQLFGNTVGLFPGDVYIDAGSRSGGQIVMRTGASGLNDRVIVEDDGRVKILNLTGSGNDYVCVDPNGYIFRSNIVC